MTYFLTTSHLLLNFLSRPGVTPSKSVPELVRCVEEMDFIGCNLNPDTTGGFWKDASLGDRAFYPLYEKMVEPRRSGDDSRICGV
ncbi:hypothetical protein P4S64_21305 [Vibrio sp. M60_M31a]